MRLIFFLTASLILPIPGLCEAAHCEDADVPAIGVRPFSLTDLSHFGTRLRDPDISKAIEAAHELGEGGQPAAAALLLTTYSDGDGERRFAVVKALGLLRVVAAPKPLNPNEWTEKKRAETFQAVALGDISFSIRRAAAFELARGERLESALKFFTEVAGNAKAFTPLYRNRAVHLAALLGGMRVSGFLREKLAGPESELVIAAAEELGEMPDLVNADALIQALGSKLPEQRTAARAALERMSGKSFQFDLVKWAEWRASFSGNLAKEIFAANSDEAPRPGKLPEVPYDMLPVDIVIAFDTTGSFLHVWAQVDQALDTVLREIAKGDPPARVGLVRYRAIDPRATLRYTLWATPLTYAFDAVQKELSIAQFGGGSGALHEGLRYALGGMAWRERSRKIIIIIGDDSPSSPVEDAMKTALQLTHDAAILDGIQVNTLYCKTTAGEENRVTYRRIAEAGIGRFYEFNKAERHLVEMGAANVDVKNTEMPPETAHKWLTPRGK